MYRKYLVWRIFLRENIFISIGLDCPIRKCLILGKLTLTSGFHRKEEPILLLRSGEHPSLCYIVQLCHKDKFPEAAVKDPFMPHTFAFTESCVLYDIFLLKINSAWVKQNHSLHVVGGFFSCLKNVKEFCT